MEEMNLNPPEHPRFPREADRIQDQNRQPTDHEREILRVFLSYKEVPKFDELPAASPEQIAEAKRRLEAIAEAAPDPLRDQDDRVLEILAVISDFPNIFGNVGYFLAAEIMNAAKKNIHESEFRRAFFQEYQPAMTGVREYLRKAAGLRRRSRSARYARENVPAKQWASPERRAAAQEQMELVQGLEDCYVMEKFWRTLEIVCSYPDFFTQGQYEQLATRKGIEQAWRAHLAKARQDYTYYRSIIHTGELFRKMCDSAVDVLRRIVLEREAGKSPGAA